MIPCTTCNRHYRVDDTACPFCAKPSGASRAMQSLGAAFTTLVLAACYGGVDDGKYDTSWDSGGTGDTSEETTRPTTDTEETGSADTSDTATTDTDTGYTTDTDTGYTTDSGTTDTDTGYATDSGTTSSSYSSSTSDSGI